jgi:hypothetical protein
MSREPLRTEVAQKAEPIASPAPATMADILDAGVYQPNPGEVNPHARNRSQFGAETIPSREWI